MDTKFKNLCMELKKLNKEFPRLLSADGKWNKFSELNSVDAHNILGSLDEVCLSVRLKRQELLIALLEAGEQNVASQAIAQFHKDIMHFSNFLNSANEVCIQLHTESCAKCGIRTPRRNVKKDCLIII